MSSRSSKRGVKGTCYQYRGLDKDTAQHSNNPFGGTVQVQNVKGARVYIWGDADVDEEEILNDDTEKHELRARGRLKANTCPDQENTTLTIERPVLTGETLQKIAVKFACEVAELKRINNLLTDQDFFALTSIKVPILKYGLMRETLEEEIRQNAGTLGVGSTNGAAVTLGVGASNDSVLELTEDSVSDGEEWKEVGSDDDDQREPLVRTVSIRNSFGNQGMEARDFLRRMDADIKDILSSTKSSKKKNLEDVRNSLICRRIYPMNHKEGYLGADCGMKLGTVVAIIIIVAIVTPLLYFLYYTYIKLPTPHPTESGS